eukprot:GHVR01085634.1.p1 GENE.GHVR01085634.1~~GHVR01085634.1.p1  ORF type:complete len:403 (+),score=77.98 GHVR01085634.1:54-1262(+)
MVTRVVLCGGGNSVHVLAAQLGAREEYEVSIFASFGDEAEKFKKGMEINGGKVTCVTRDSSVSGTPAVVTNQAKDVVPNADILVLAVPSFAHRGILQDVVPFIKKGVLIVAMPGQGGFQWVARKTLKNLRSELNIEDVIIAGTSQLPFQCRINDFGQSVELFGYKRKVHVGTVPPLVSPKVATTLTNMLQTTEVIAFPDIICITLMPGNQLIHPSIMHGLFHEYVDGQVLKEAPFFYEQVDDFTADTMQKVSDEIQMICEKLSETMKRPELASSVPSVGDMMRFFYQEELVDPSTVKSIFRTNKGYAGLRAPVVKVEGGCVPDFKYRYLTEDIPHGLCVLKGVAKMVGVPTPTIDSLILWGQEKMGRDDILTKEGEFVSGKTSTCAPQHMGVQTVQDLMCQT